MILVISTNLAAHAAPTQLHDGDVSSGLSAAVTGARDCSCLSASTTAGR